MLFIDSEFSIKKIKFLQADLRSGFTNIFTFFEFRVRDKFSSYETKVAKVPMELYVWYFEEIMSPGVIDWRAVGSAFLPSEAMMLEGNMPLVTSAKIFG